MLWIIFAAAQEQEAKHKARETAQTLRFWFRKKYNLPPNDPRFLALTDEEIETEYWTYYYEENPDVEEFDDPNYAEKMANLESLDMSEWEDIDINSV